MANLTNSAKLIEEMEKKVNSSSLATVATSGSYTDLSNKPTIPTVNDSTITVQKNGANVGSFTTNAAAGKTINIQLAKSDVGLGNVDNTSDANKPISTATQIALNNKQDTLIPSTGITINASNEISTTALPGTTKYGASLDLSIDDTTFVVTAQLKDQDGNNLGTPKTIDLPLESVVVSGSYDSATKKVILTLKDGSTVDFSVADLVSGLQSEITSTNKLNADLVDDTNSTHKFVSATEKSTWNGKQAALTTAQLNAANSGITATKVGTYDGYATSKQDKLATQTAYSQKGSATKVPQITTNTLGQVTGITEIDIDGGGTYNAGEGISIGEGQVNARKGPSPDGFHVPSATEWQSISSAGVSLGAWSGSNGNNVSTYLKIPKAGYREYSTLEFFGNGLNGEYRSSTPYDSDDAYCFYFDERSVEPRLNDHRSMGAHVRCLKDYPVVPDSNWTVLYQGTGTAGIYHNSTSGLISISSNGTTWYTIMDKNLGATTVYNYGDTMTEANCGKVYQWGNNYAFSGDENYDVSQIAQSDTQVDVTGYGPGNYYESSTWITDYPRQTDNNDGNDLRGDVSGTIAQENVITNTGVLSVNGQTGNVTVASPDMSNYLAKDNTTSFTPTGDYQPATKKYVDDKSATVMTASEYSQVSSPVAGKIYFIKKS